MAFHINENCIRDLTTRMVVWEPPNHMWVAMSNICRRVDWAGDWTLAFIFWHFSPTEQTVPSHSTIYVTPHIIAHTLCRTRRAKIHRNCVHKMKKWKLYNPLDSLYRHYDLFSVVDFPKQIVHYRLDCFTASVSTLYTELMSTAERQRIPKLVWNRS